MPTELSPKNPRVERVRDLRTPRGRREAGAFAAEGPTLLEEARRSGLRPREIYGSTEALARIDTAALEGDGIEVWSVPERVFSRLSDLDTPTGLLAVFALPGTTAEDVLETSGPVLLLAGVGDPGNAGTLVRAAEAFGAGGVLFGTGGADPYSPKVVRAAMGSLFRLPVAQIDAESVLAAAAERGRLIVATDLDGEDVRDAELPRDIILAVGNERRGVRDWLPRWDRAVRIPQRGETESLNAAVAGSIVLYELTRAARA